MAFAPKLRGWRSRLGNPGSTTVFILLLCLHYWAQWSSPKWIGNGGGHEIWCRTLNMHLWQVSLAGDFRSLIGCLSVIFGGALNFDVADSLDSAYLDHSLDHGLISLSNIKIGTFSVNFLTTMESNVFRSACHSVHRGLYDVTSCLVVWSHVIFGGEPAH